MVAEVREVFSGSVTYDQLVWTLLEPEVYGTFHQFLWADGGFDVIGLSAWFPLVEEVPTSVLTVEELQGAWEPLFNDVLLPLRDANPDRPIMFTEFGFVDDPVCRTCDGFAECAARRIRMSSEAQSTKGS